MNLVKILEIVLKLWWVVLIFALVTAIGAYSISSFLMTPKYTSEAKVYVSGTIVENKAGLNAADISTSKLLVSTYTEILKGNSFLDKVSSDFNATNDEDWEVSRGEIKGGLEMSSPNENEVLYIKYSDIDPKKAQKVLDALLRKAPDEIERILNGSTLKVIDNASLPNDTSYPNTEQNTFLGLFLGVILGIVVIFLRELFDTRIKDDEDLQTRYNVPVLGIVPNLDEE